MVARARPRMLFVGLLLAAGSMVSSTAGAQLGAPPRPIAPFKNSAALGLSYGVNNDRDATFWGWTTEYSRQVGDRWFAAGSIMWDRETEDTFNGSDVEIDTFTVAGTISYGLTKRLAITTGLGKGFADTDNPSKAMEFTNGDLSTGIVLGWSTPGLKHCERDSVAFSLAYEYNFTQSETSLSLDVAFGWSF